MTQRITARRQIEQSIRDLGYRGSSWGFHNARKRPRHPDAPPTLIRLRFDSALGTVTFRVLEHGKLRHKIEVTIAEALRDDVIDWIADRASGKVKRAPIAMACHFVNQTHAVWTWSSAISATAVARVGALARLREEWLWCTCIECSGSAVRLIEQHAAVRAGAVPPRVRERSKMSESRHG